MDGRQDRRERDWRTALGILLLQVKFVTIPPSC